LRLSRKGRERADAIIPEPAADAATAANANAPSSSDGRWWRRNQAFLFGGGFGLQSRLGHFFEFLHREPVRQFRFFALLLLLLTLARVLLRRHLLRRR